MIGNPRHGISFDSSALSKLADETLPSVFCRKMNLRSSVLMLPLETLSELLKGGQTERVWRRINFLYEVLRIIGHRRFFVFDTIGNFFDHEFLNRKLIPHESKVDNTRTFFKYASNFESFSQHHHDFHSAVSNFLNVDEIHSASLEVSKEGSNSAWDSVNDDIYIMLGDENYSKRWIAPHWVMETLRREQSWQPYLDNVIQNPRWYPAFVAYAIYFDLIAVSAFINDDRPSHLRTFRLRESNNWIDARILSVSTYADILVTNDDRIGLAAKYIRSVDGIVPAILTSQEFMSLRK